MDNQRLQFACQCCAGIFQGDTWSQCLACYALFCPECIAMHSKSFSADHTCLVCPDRPIALPPSPTAAREASGEVDWKRCDRCHSLRATNEKCQLCGWQICGSCRYTVQKERACPLHRVMCPNQKEVENA